MSASQLLARRNTGGLTMTKLIVDAATRARLNNLDGPLEMCDESGKTLGYFQPLNNLAGQPGPVPRSPFSDEELQKRRQQRTGRSLSEVLERLNQL
jgi:hypothetical protein